MAKRSKKPEPPTAQQLADAIGWHNRTLRRRWEEGLPRIDPGEAIESWAKRALSWIETNRRKPGPKPYEKKGTAAKLDEAEMRFRNARARNEELDVAEREGKLHSKEECERDETQRWLEVKAALLQVGATVAPRLLHQTEPQFVQAQIDEEIRLALERFTAEPAAPPPPNAEDAADDDADDGAAA